MEDQVQKGLTIHFPALSGLAYRVQLWQGTQFPDPSGQFRVSTSRSRALRLFCERQACDNTRKYHLRLRFAIMGQLQVLFEVTFL